jgi:hypothetical protein
MRRGRIPHKQTHSNTNQLPSTVGIKTEPIMRLPSVTTLVGNEIEGDDKNGLILCVERMTAFTGFPVMLAAWSNSILLIIH